MEVIDLTLDSDDERDLIEHDLLRATTPLLPSNPRRKPPAHPSHAATIVPATNPTSWPSGSSRGTKRPRSMMQRLTPPSSFKTRNSRSRSLELASTSKRVKHARSRSRPGLKQTGIFSAADDPTPFALTGRGAVTGVAGAGGLTGGVGGGSMMVQTLSTRSERAFGQQVRGMEVQQQQLKTEKRKNEWDGPGQTKRFKATTAWAFGSTMDMAIEISDEEDMDDVQVVGESKSHKYYLKDEDPDWESIHPPWYPGSCFHLDESRVLPESRTELIIPVPVFPAAKPGLRYGGRLIEGHVPQDPPYSARLCRGAPIRRVSALVDVRTQGRIASGLAPHRYLRLWEQRPLGTGSGPNVIAQSGKLVVFGSSAAEGNSSHSRISAANRETMVAYRGSSFTPMNGHTSALPDTGHLVKRHWNVHDIQFSSRPSSVRQKMVSCGADGQILIWDVNQHVENYRDDRDDADCEMSDDDIGSEPFSITLSNNRHGTVLSFLDNSPRCLVGTNTGSLLLFDIDDPFPELQQATVAPQPIAALICGHGPTDDMVYASTGCSGQESGMHRAYQATSAGLQLKGNLNMSFPQRGSTFEVSPDGTQAALTTCSRDSRTQSLTMFDLRGGSCPTFRSRVPLPDLPDRKIKLSGQQLTAAPLEQSTNAACFSPDGRFVLIARTDSLAMIYDTHFLKSPVTEWVHPGVGGEGIAEAFWVTGNKGLGAGVGGLGVVTGGSDGTIRLWDPRKAKADQQGEVIATLEAAVANFHLGDVRRGEIPLVAGDSEGMLYVFGYGNKLGPLENQ